MARMPKYWKRKWSNESYWIRKRQEKNIQLKPNSNLDETKNIQKNKSCKKLLSIFVFAFIILCFLIVFIVREKNNNTKNKTLNYQTFSYNNTNSIIQDVAQIKINKKGWVEDKGTYFSFETLAQRISKKIDNPIFFPLLTFYNELNEPTYYACQDFKWKICGSNGFTSPFVLINKKDLPDYSYYEWRAVNRLPNKMGKQ